MIKELKLSNFRLFDDEVRVRFRPITVFIGKNNSGKSSIIKFLLMLQQSMNSDNTQLLNPDGEKVKLGDFGALKNVRSEKKELSFELAASAYRSGGATIWRYLKPNYKDFGGGNIRIATKAVASYENGKQIVKKHEAVLFDPDKKEEVLHKNRHMQNCDERPLLDFSKEFEEEEKRSDTKTHAVEKDFIKALRNNINSLQHLQAAREDPSAKIISTARPPIGNVGQDGRYALGHLYNLYNHKEVLSRIKKHIEAIAGIEEIKFEEASDSWVRCRGVYKKTGAEIPIGDFGFGAGQVLPVLVQGFIQTRHTQLMVEQPEAQLHPTAQLELGTFFADLWKQRNVGSIIETHSDNVLLRLRRLIAKGELQSDDVSVAFFYIDEEQKPQVKNLDIKRDGSMEEGLPIEFFHANIEEALKMRVGR